MSRGIEKLTARTVQTAKGTGNAARLLSDGRGLYLRVSPTGSKSWILRYARNGKQHDMGLGPYPEISLAGARERALEQRRLLIDGNDPLAARRAVAVAKAIAEARSITFADAAERYIKSQEKAWRDGGRNAGQWRQTIRDYANPVFGKVPIADIDRALVLKAIEPIWESKSETASRVRRRIADVLSWATAHGLRTGDNPAEWDGGIEHILPAKSRVAPVQHFAAMPYSELGAFMSELRTLPSASAIRALEFTILTACRAGEVLGAQWEEIDVVQRIWTVPALRTKTSREHRVPLSDAAMAVLQQCGEKRTGLVFPSSKGSRMNDKMMRRVLQEQLRWMYTVHGFRSTFSQWAAERTAYSYEVREIALAHNVGNAVERSYQRSDLFDRRRQLMAAWAELAASPAPATDEIVPLHA
jgi:integrase